MKKYLFPFLAAVVLAACQSKESYIQEVDQFVEKVKKESAHYTEKDWEKADKEFTRLTENAYKEFAEDLSLDEKMELAKSQTAYTALKAKAGIKSLGKGIEDAARKLDEAMKEKEE